MTDLSFAVLGAASLLGLVLAALHGTARRPGALLAAVHGSLGLAGVGVLLAALRGPAHGAAGLGPAALVLLLGTLLLGLVPLAARLRRRGLPVLAVGLHATLAIMGIVVLAAYASLPG